MPIIFKNRPTLTDGIRSGQRDIGYTTSVRENFLTGGIIRSLSAEFMAWCQFWIHKLYPVGLGLVTFFLIFFLIFFLPVRVLLADEPRAIEVPPVLIHQTGLEEQTRSVQWHSSSSPSPSILNLPQMDEALNGLNGLQARSQGSPGFSLRGSAQSGRVLILFNDIPLNFASGFGASPIFLPKEMIGSVSLIKGPASLFYGSQAMAGSLNFIPRNYTQPQMTLTLSDTDESFFPWRKGGLGHHNWHLASPLLQTKKYFLQASLVSETNDGQFPYRTSSVHGAGVRQFNGGQLLRLVINGKTQWNKFKFNYDAIAGIQKKQSPGPIHFPLKTEGRTRGILASVTPHYFFNDQQSFRSKISYMETHSTFTEDQTDTFNKQRTWILQNEWIVDFSHLTQLQFFVDHFRHELDNSFAGNGLRQEHLEMGPFISFHSFSGLKHQMGGRYLSQGKYFLPTFKTSLSFKNYESWVSYSQGFRSPNLSDLFSKSPFFTGNPHLEPERSEQYEWGLKETGNTLSQSWTFDLRLFWMEYKNFIESFEIKPGLFSRKNQGQGYARGLDLGTNYPLGPLTVELNYNFLETRKKSTGQAFRLSPRHQISWGGVYKFNVLDMELRNVHWYKNSDVSHNENIELDDWQQWNLLVHSRFWKNLKISLGLINVFNEKKTLSFNYPEPQRRYWLQMTYSFSD